jgi:hypothetical protein
MDRVNEELREQEMNRVPPEDEEGHEDKFVLKIRLKSWSHSIRPNQVNEWNEGMDKIKLFPAGENRKELIVQFTMPKLIQGQLIWHAGLENSMIFVAALNIATMGFFWWYVPTFTSRFYESLYDVEKKTDLIVERSPELMVSWGHQAMKTKDYNFVGGVYGFIAKERSDPQKAFVFGTYTKILGLMAKNDIFGQFEPMLLLEFVNLLRAAFFAYGDWCGKDEAFNAALEAVFQSSPNWVDVFEMAKDMVGLAWDSSQGKNTTRPITMEEVGKAKLAFDIYINLKVKEYLPQAIKEFQEKQKPKDEAN